jgi:hypothetical protein
LSKQVLRVGWVRHPATAVWSPGVGDRVKCRGLLAEVPGEGTGDWWCLSRAVKGVS